MLESQSGNVNFRLLSSLKCKPSLAPLHFGTTFDNDDDYNCNYNGSRGKTRTSCSTTNT